MEKGDGRERHWDHSVRLYRELESCAEHVAHYLAESLRRGDVGLAVVRPELATSLLTRLQSLGCGKLLSKLLLLDAEETLGRFMIDQWPDERRFRSVIEPCLEQCAAEGVGVSAFGEMVALLCEQGQHDAAVRLEELWNGLGRQHDFRLLCAYSLRLFADDAGARVFRSVCCSHSHVAPAEQGEAASTPAHALALAELEQKTAQLERLLAERNGATEPLASDRISPSRRRAEPRLRGLPPARQRQGRALIVDDHAESASCLAEAMTLSGWDVRVASGAEPELTALHEFAPDTAFIRVGMAGVDACKLAVTLRRKRAPAGLRIFAVAGPGEFDQERSDGAGFDAYLMQPR